MLDDWLGFGLKCKWVTANVEAKTTSEASLIDG